MADVEFLSGILSDDDVSKVHPDRFKNPHTLSHTEDETGPTKVKLIGAVENGITMFDFGKPIQTLALTPDDLKALGAMCLESYIVASIQSMNKGTTH